MENKLLFLIVILIIFVYFISNNNKEKFTTYWLKDNRQYYQNCVDSGGKVSLAENGMGYSCTY